jgi:DNA-directed RNA polymerase I, II, and III subunit RPABC1
MDDIEKLFRSRKTILEMFRDRGYRYKPDLWIERKDDFKKLFYSKNIDFVAETADGVPVFVKWILYIKIKPNLIKDTIDEIRTQNFAQETAEDGVKSYAHHKIILVSKAKSNTNITKIFKEKEFRGTELFWLNSIVFNITKHMFVPKHELMSEEDVKQLMTELYISNKYNLPVMLKSDPMTRYLNLNTGDVCKIVRYSPTSGQYYTYRVVK